MVELRSLRRKDRCREAIFRIIRARDRVVFFSIRLHRDDGGEEFIARERRRWTRNTRAINCWADEVAGEFQSPNRNDRFELAFTLLYQPIDARDGSLFDHGPQEVIAV